MSLILLLLLQDAKGADDPARLLEMRKRFGAYCIPPKVLLIASDCFWLLLIASDCFGAYCIPPKVLKAEGIALETAF